MFGRFSITLHRVRDTITVREGGEELTLKVDQDPRIMVVQIRNAQDRLNQANKPEATDEDRERAARQFSNAIFGEAQTEKLAEFYSGNYSCVVTICGIYFEKRLCKKIVAAQKKQK